MKKNLLMIILLCSSIFCFSADYRVIKDSKIYDDNFYSIGIINKDTIVKKTKTYIYDGKRYTDRVDYQYGTDIIYNGEECVINLESIIPAQTEELFDEEIISNKLERKELYWTTETILDILKSNTRDNYYRLFKETIEAYEQRKGIYDEMEWYEGVCFNKHNINNISLVLSDDIKYSYYYFIDKIEKTSNGYLVTCELNDSKIEQISYLNDKLETLRNQEEITYRFIKDGDYLYIYSMDNKLLFVYVLVNKSVSEQYETLFQKEKADLSKVTWPRHADGTCDYDGSSTTKTFVSQQSTNVSQNKTMSVTENLKLRSGEATSTQVLTVMSAGTKVKILELGKAETIDGIDSNWVKVEVQKGAKDRDGKEIKKGTVGWCYGGYLE